MRYLSKAEDDFVKILWLLKRAFVSLRKVPIFWYRAVLNNVILGGEGAELP